MTDIAHPAAEALEREKALERENADLRQSDALSKHQLATARKALNEERNKSARLERQLEGYDEDLHDPSKQKGIGAIPIGDHHLFHEVEKIEARLGMSPTTDQQLRALGMKDPAQQVEQLTSGEVTAEDIVAEVVAPEARKELEAAIRAITIDVDGGDTENGPTEAAAGKLGAALHALDLAGASHAYGAMMMSWSHDCERLRRAAESFFGGDFRTPPQEDE